MKIVIVGAGRAGLEVATHLTRIGHSVTIIDNDESVVRRASEQFIQELHLGCVPGEEEMDTSPLAVAIDKVKPPCLRVLHFDDTGNWDISLSGDATVAAVLDEADVAQSDVVVAMLRRDADNLAVALLARAAGVERVMVRMRDNAYRPV